MAEEIINTLTKLRGLRVTARTSSFSFRGKQADIREIAAKLNVESILEGSVYKAGNRIRITAQLINAADGYHLWSERFDRELKDVFAVQDEISQAIADKLRLRLAGGAPPVKRYTENAEAYNLLLKARYQGGDFTAAGLERSKKYHEQAIATDPNYALAWSSMAGHYYVRGYLGFMPPKAANALSRQAALKAIELDNSLAEAHSRIAVLRANDYDWKGAEEEFRKAMELDPKSQDVLSDYVYYYLVPMGRLDEAIAHAQKVLAVDPLSPFLHWRLGIWHYLKRERDPAIDQFNKALQLDPQYLYAHVFLSMIYIQTGKYDEAVRHGETAAKVVGYGPSSIGMLSGVYAATGRVNEARKLLEELKKIAQQTYVSANTVAFIYQGLGDIDRCFEWYGRAIEEREAIVFFVRDDPRMDPLRSDPRYHALLRKMNLK